MSAQQPGPSPAGYGTPSSSYPPGSARAGPSHFAGAQQQRPLSPGAVSLAQDTQKTTFMAPFERFYDALVDSRTLQMTLTDLSMRTSEIHRRGEEDLRRFNHTHSQAANLLNTLQASSTSLQDMVRKEVAVVREETRIEVAGLWKRIRQLEGGLTAAGMQVPPATPSSSSAPLSRGLSVNSATTAAPVQAAKRAASELADEDDQLAGGDGSAPTSEGEDGGGPSAKGARRASRGAKAGGSGRGGAPAKAPKGTRGGGKVGGA